MKHISRIAAILFAALSGIAACSSVDDDEVSAAQAAVKRQLTDPDSAKFDGDFVIYNRMKDGLVSHVTVCGTVNSKNTLGGYAGATRYVATSDSDVTKFPRIAFETENLSAAAPAEIGAKPGESTFESIYWNKSCVDEKHPPTYTARHG